MFGHLKIWYWVIIVALLLIIIVTIVFYVQMLIAYNKVKEKLDNYDESQTRADQINSPLSTLVNWDGTPMQPKKTTTFTQNH